MNLPGPLVLDRRAELGDTPGLHALIVGIGHYQYLPAPGQPGLPAQFGLTSVDGPAISAYRIAQRLQNPVPGAILVRPLKTLRLLLAPTANDAQAEPALANWPGPAPTLETLQDQADAWRTDCEASNDEAAFFSFTGHGVCWGDDCLVLADFGKGAKPGNMKLENCIIREELVTAMSGPADGEVSIARRQFWFIDACRAYVGDDRPGQVGRPSQLLQPRREDGLRMDVGGLASTARGTSAFVIDAKVGTAFGAALLVALGGALDEAIPWPPDDNTAPDLWPTNVIVIQQAIQLHLGRNPSTRDQQTKLLGGNMTQPLLLFQNLPTIDLYVSVRPPRMPVTIVSLQLQQQPKNGAQPVQVCPIDPHPKCLSCPAGPYQVDYMVGDKPQTKFKFLSMATNELAL